MIENTIERYSYCTHEEVAPRRRTRINGAVVVVAQCVKCGSERRTLPKRDFDFDALPAFDESLIEQENENARAFYAGQRERIDTYIEQQREAEREARRQNYRTYLHSDHWARLKLRALARDNYHCQHCGRTVTADTSNAHHILPWGYETWQNFGYSMLFEVVTLCLRCHAKAHGGEE